jgi:hypothetical protein
MNATTVINSAFPVLKLLIDVGSAIWLFKMFLIKVPTNNFDDYLGKGFSGDGKSAN